MADYFTHFSLVVRLPSEFAQAYALETAHQAEVIRDGGEMPEGFPAELVDALDDWQFETAADRAPGRWGVWLHSDRGGVDAVALFIQHLLAKFDPSGAVPLEWSHDCTKPRTDAFGGGAAFITARKVRTLSTAGWLEKQAAAFARNPPRRKG